MINGLLDINSVPLVQHREIKVPKDGHDIDEENPIQRRDEVEVECLGGGPDDVVSLQGWPKVRFHVINRFLKIECLNKIFSKKLNLRKFEICKRYKKS